MAEYAGEEALFRDNIEGWKMLADKANEALKRHVCIVDLEGNEVASSGKIPFLIQLIGSCDYGKKALAEFRKDALRAVLNEPGKVQLQRHELGFCSVWAALADAGRVAGAIGCPYVIEAGAENSDFSSLTKNSNIEEDEIKDALSKANPAKEEDRKAIASVLRALSSFVPAMLNESGKDKRKIAELSAIYNLTKMTNSSLELDRIIRHIVDYMVEEGKAKNCSVMIIENGAVKKKYSFNPMNGLEPLESAIASEIINLKSNVEVNDFSKDFRFKGIKAGDIKSAISLPIRMRGNLLGALCLYYSGYIKLNSDHSSFLSVVADQLAMAIYNAQEFEHAKEESVVDNLTGLYNRRHFMAILRDKFMKNASKQNPVSVALMDIDDFKHYNDAHGHVRGDSLLQEISAILKNKVRDADVAGRYGGEEFIVIMPNTSVNDAKAAMERIRKDAETGEFFGRQKQPKGNITMSIGIVTCMDSNVDYMHLVDAADKTMYRSKSFGKNRISSAVILDKNMSMIDAN
ncbi:sensor domain-containing diguanylate cyclase [Candidatus Woesearchaeota archaeon]|nr:sensor domain-containing diguanylate cyclase [Candidatus Woesearchaeota archaeon]